MHNISSTRNDHYREERNMTVFLNEEFELSVRKFVKMMLNAIPKDEQVIGVDINRSAQHRFFKETPIGMASLYGMLDESGMITDTKLTPADIIMTMCEWPNHPMLDKISIKTRSFYEKLWRPPIIYGDPIMIDDFMYFCTRHWWRDVKGPPESVQFMMLHAPTKRAFDITFGYHFDFEKHIWDRITASVGRCCEFSGTRDSFSCVCYHIEGTNLIELDRRVRVAGPWCVNAARLYRNRFTLQKGGYPNYVDQTN